MTTATASRRVDTVNELGNEVDDGASAASGMIEVAAGRAAQEVQGMMVVAKKFPRDETRALNRILNACKRQKLAEAAVYAYPRGSETVEGPTIRLAEAMAQNWGNLDFGVIELEQTRGTSTMMAFCWDVETNTRQQKVFSVKHERHTRKGGYALTDPRDVYELTANQGARRLRSCILGIIPGDVVEAALAQCDKTMAGASDMPLIDRVRKMLAVFEEYGVNQEHMEARLGHRLDVTTESELSGLRKIYRALKDNMADVAAFFPSLATNGSVEDRERALREKMAAKGAAGQVAAPQQSAAPTHEQSSQPQRFATAPTAILSDEDLTTALNGAAMDLGLPESAVRDWRAAHLPDDAKARAKMQPAKRLEIWNAFVAAKGVLPPK